MNEQIKAATVTVDAPAAQPTRLPAAVRLGQELDLFSVHPEGRLWHPKGARLRALVEQIWREEHFRHGYELVGSPAGAADRFHLDVFGQRARRQRELPLRLAELDGAGPAHIFATREQLAVELARAVDFCRHLARAFGLTELTARGTEPLELLVHADDGRAWSCATLAVDAALAGRRGLSYLGSDGQEHPPVVLRRTLFGSIDRLVDALVEHHAGAFPLWLAPLQARVITGTDAHHAWAEEVRASLAAQGQRVDLDLSGDKLAVKVRRAQLEKIPLVLVCGDKEVAAGAVAPRTREGAQMPAMPLAEFAQWMEHEAQIPRPAARA